MARPSALLVRLCSLLLLVTFQAQAAVITWDDGAGDSNWNSALNWDTDTVPGAGDDAVINFGGGLVVTVNTAESVNSVTCNDALTLSANTLTIAAASTINDFSQSGGTLNGAGTVTLTGTATWTGGTQSGAGNTTVQSGTTLTITAAANATLDTRSMTNDGTIVFIGASSYYLNNGAALTNNAGATVDIQGTAVNLFPLAGTGSIDNQGTFLKSSSAGTSIVTVFFDQTGGSLDVQTGTLNLVGTGSHSSGTWTVAAATTLGFTGATHTFTGTHSGVISGTLTASTTFTVATAATFNFTGNGLSWTAGTWNGGGTLTNDGTITATAAASATLDAATTLTNNGTVDFIGTSSFYISNSSVLNNTAAATLDIQNDLTLWQLAGTGTVTNAGTLLRSAGAGTATVQVGLTNTGTVDVDTGILSSTGVFSNFAGTTLTGGTYDIAATFRFTGADIVTNAATIILDGAGSAIQDGGATDAFTNYATNAAGGSLELRNSRNLTTPGR
ncbi:MAG: hypothetical protein QF689_13555 [Candidatus Latescibacteria bacterium]|jgi:hypothetical protein|nr:hypothetical protein [Candidatus Latescibacterota bacterium]